MWARLFVCWLVPLRPLPHRAEQSGCGVDGQVVVPMPIGFWGFWFWVAWGVAGFGLGLGLVGGGWVGGLAFWH